MQREGILLVAVLLLSACSQGVAPMTDKTQTPCGDKPNCVSTQESRDKFALAPFILRPGVTLDQIERVALTLQGAKTADKQDNYLRIECTTRFLRFVDDLEIRLRDDHLIVRSESRVGYSDFGVNRRRAENLREKLAAAGMLRQP
ncbi:DUF1499 domain-containing protein [Vibrio sp. ABG19]|uniref:DUF1499 domain-containing protein n=1 Tax=Vibrio sp. ABG19 TaxID=2817385 RepID=UPI00249F2989|nr:DUF1499 domain-containing protein [Vibrio sp. ABG19]WGY46098.1 DUF1499 domain-containing protein [Vibrio sp. ABG19]